MEDINQVNRKLKFIYRNEEEDVAKRVAAKTGLPYLNLSVTPIESDALSLVQEEQARRAGVAVISRVGYRLHIAVFNPKFQLAEKIVKKLSKKGFSINLFVVSKSSLRKAWMSYANVSKEHFDNFDISEQDIKQFQSNIKTISDLREQIAKVSTTQLLGVILAGALNTNASDVHLEPGESQLRLRYRIDGVLFDIAYLPQKIFNKLSSRIKVLSKLKLNLRNVPQNGRFAIEYGIKRIDIRVSILPGTMGETIVLRVLNPDIIALKLEDLGLEKDHLDTIRKNIAKPTGMLLNTGPTGCGKTTTLYACLMEVHKPGINIITLEDPVEYALKGITQSQIDASNGYNFSDALKNVLRQDPDIILLGEIRDKETATTALNAALTGHSVFSTLHTNEAAGAIPRFLEMGVKAFVISPAVNLIIAQRLVRKIHKACHGKGCAKCNGTGYKGRIGIFEMFEFDDEIKEIVANAPSFEDIKKLLKKKGMRTMKEDGMLKVKKGITTKQEIERVTLS